MLAVLVWIDAAVFGDRAVSWRHVSRRGDLMSLPWLTQLVGKLLITRAAQLGVCAAATFSAGATAAPCIARTSCALRWAHACAARSGTRTCAHGSPI